MDSQAAVPESHGSQDILERHQAEQDLGERFSRRLKVEDVDLDHGFDSMILVRNRILCLAGDLQGKEVLDLGCGLGRLSVSVARRGAGVTALDISDGMLEFAAHLAAKYDVSDRVRTVRGEGERLPFPDASFDLVVGSGILHHLVLDMALPEIQRVLKPGGKAIFEEPLGHNPFLNLFRRFTPDQRSAFEKPFRMADVDRMGRHFSEMRHEEHYLLTIPLFWIKKYMPLNWGRTLITACAAMDRALVRALPPLRKHCWVTIISLKK